ncbi:YbaB/EbfC family nucleoid-associated protein [Amycolatopsis sp. lyj-23]|uniref:YbaB/EbfC family nucleoid-associated protein n=1 Tax=Amycolatopsis sp. lyj-23 TaxID=2789283 RepID=UPI0039788FC5
MTDNAQLIEELRWQLKQIEDRKAENQRRLAGIAASDLTAVVSPDRSVTVLAAPGGVISEVRLAPEAMRFDAVTLSRTITAAVREAAGVRPAAAPPPQAPPPRPPERPRQAAPRPPRPAPADDDAPYDTVFDV